MVYHDYQINITTESHNYDTKKQIIYNLEKESQNYERRHKLCNESHNLSMESRHDEKMTCSIKAKFSSFLFFLFLFGSHGIP